MTHKSLGVVLDCIIAWVTIDFRVVAINDDVCWGHAQGIRQQLGGPEKAVLFGSPCMFGSATKAVDKDNVGSGIGVGVDIRELVRRHFEVDGPHCVSRLGNR